MKKSQFRTMQKCLIILLCILMLGDCFHKLPNFKFSTEGSCFKTIKSTQYFELHPQIYLDRNIYVKLSIDDVSMQVYDTQLWFSDFVESQISNAGPLSLILLYASGLLTAFSPCVLGLLPLTLAYLGIEETDSNRMEESNTRLIKAISYAFGMSVLFCLFGISAAFLGQALSPSTTIRTVAGMFLSVVTILMGLNLLELIQLTFPDFSNVFNVNSSDSSSEKSKFQSSIAEPFLFGASSAIIGSPCSSPVLASLIAIIGSSGKPILGIIFLFAYSLGYVTPVITAGFLSGSVNAMLSRGKNTGWINDAFASILITFGVYKTLENFETLFFS